MEENPWGNCSYDLEMDHEVTESLCDTNNIFEEEFLRDIFPQTPQDLFPSLPIANNNSSINVVSPSTDQHVAEMPSSCILSFDKSTVLLPPTQQRNNDPLKHSRNRRRSPTASLDHIMAERKRRKEITMKFIELSALLPGLKKTDKGYVLREAINHVKQLEERVKELEQDIKKRDMESVTNDVAIGEKNSEESYECNQSLPQVEAIVLGKEVLIRVHCVRQKGIVVDIMSQLQLHHLSITSSNILPFRNTLGINIVAQMDDDCNLIVKALVKKLRLVATLQTCDDVQP
ncbi:transcription factor bHLH18-like [Vicia villosa]|uniref:transcription factor bHLH18-like n=1 Tax=Vicia villosa TaxID=3911 RepID=UPI00273AB06C|nr:transcription factor bHLH18-like [Vicia villosa]